MKLGESDKKEALKCVEDVKKDVCDYFKPFQKLFKDEEELYYGVVWKNITEFRPFENNVFDIIETAVPILSDNLPAPSVSVKDPRRKEHAKLLERRLKKENKDQGFALKYPDVVRGQLVTGTGWVHPYYDFDENNGKGGEVYETLHFSQVQVSGETTDISKVAKARITLQRTRDWLIQKYPKYKKQLEKAKAPEDSDDHEERGLENVDSGGSYSRRFVPPKYQDKDTLELVLTYKRDSSLEKIPREETAAQIQEAIEAIQNGQAPDSDKYQDHKAFILALLEFRKEIMMGLGLAPDSLFEQVAMAVEEIAELNPEAAEQFEQQLLSVRLLDDAIEERKILQDLNPEGGRLKYPGGYRVIETVNEIVLYDGKNKSKHGKIPLVPFYCYRNKSIYGLGMIRNIADSQRMQAVLGYSEYKGLQKVSNPEKEVNEQSGLTPEDISNEPGAVYGVKEGTNWTVRNLPPGQISEQGVRFQNDRVEKMRQISGMTDPTRGELPDGRLSEVTVTKTQNQALGRIRLKDRQNQYFSLKLLAELVASDLIQYESSETILDIEEVDGEFNEVIFNPIEVQDLDYDIEFDADTMASVDKDQYNLFLTSLLNQGHITFSQYTQLVDVPRVEKLKEFAGENDQVQAQVQEVSAQLESMQVENLKLKSEVQNMALAQGLELNLMTPEEMTNLENIKREEQLQAMGGPNEGQPLA